MSKVAAVVVTYNNNQMLACLLADLQRQTRLPDEIIVVDNSDNGNAARLIKERFSQVKYIKMPENTGSAGGYYAGIKAAMVNNDFIWTLDDDVRVPDDSLQELIKGFCYLEVSCKIAIARSVGEKNALPARLAPMEIFTWRGSLIKTEVFLKEGLINKEFFIYGEDLDFSYRLIKKGYKFFWIPTSLCCDIRTSDKVQYRFFRQRTLVYSEAVKLYYAFRNHVYINMRFGYYSKMIKTLIYGLKVILLILSAEGWRSLAKVKAVGIGIIHGFIGKLGKSYNVNINFLMKIKPCFRAGYLLMRKLLLLPLLFFSRNHRSIQGEIKTILILRYDRIGDMVLSIPVFRILKNKYPKARITVVASQVNADVIKNDPDVDEIFIYKGMAHFFKAIRQRRYDLAIDLFYTYELHSAFLTFISGARYRMGFAAGGREIFFNLESRQASKCRNLSDYFISLIWGGNNPEDLKYKLQLHFSEAAAHWADSYLKTNNLMTGSLKIAMHPGGFYQSQRWPAERFAAVSRAVTEEFGARVLLFGNLQEEGLLNEIANLALQARPLLLFDIPLEKTMALIAKCDILIANNSGLLHIAAALDIPTVSMIGPTDLKLWMPVGGKNTVIRKDLSCSPCAKGFCADHSCMKLISPEDVMAALSEQLKKRSLISENGVF